MKEAKFEMLERVHVKSITSRRFEGEIVDRYQDEEGEWFYTIDRRNYLHEAMLERVNPTLFPDTIPTHDPGGKVRLRIPAGIASYATFSECKRFRYALTRHWGDGKTLLVCMRNPSEATAEYNDPTVAKMQRYARAWGFGALTVVNMFAYRCTDPKRLREVDDPVGPENDEHIRQQAEYAGLILMAYGVPPQKELRQRGPAVRTCSGVSDTRCMRWS